MPCAAGAPILQMQEAAHPSTGPAASRTEAPSLRSLSYCTLRNAQGDTLGIRRVYVIVGHLGKYRIARIVGNRRAERRAQPAVLIVGYFERALKGCDDVDLGWRASLDSKWKSSAIVPSRGRASMLRRRSWNARKSM
mgnify:CR=1 FL=1